MATIQSPTIPLEVAPKAKTKTTTKTTTATDTEVSAKPKAKRFFHEFDSDVPRVFPDSSDALMEENRDKSIMYWDGALSAAECEKIIADFESSSKDHFAGGVFIRGENVNDDAVKKNTELSITEEAAVAFKWFPTETLLTKAVNKHLALYQESNIILSTQQNPFGDEGFRMKRYANDGTEHHAYHADSGHELVFGPRRIMAVLIYLNTVEEGGETVFLYQNVAVKPVQGRLLLFPTSYSFVHAGRRPISNQKYVIVNFLTT